MLSVEGIKDYDAMTAPTGMAAVILRNEVNTLNPEPSTPKL